MKRILVFLLALACFPAQAQTVTTPAIAAMVCANNTVIPAPTNGQFFYVQCDSNGKLITTSSGSGTLPSVAAVLTNQAYTTQSTDLGKLLTVTTGAGNATITLLSAVTAGNGAVQYITKIDNGSVTVSGTADNGGGLIRLTVNSTASLTTGLSYVVSGVYGTREADATWVITVIDGTHVDLQGSTFTNAYLAGGQIGGGRATVTDGSTELAWLSAIKDIAAFQSNGTSWTAVGWNIAPITDAYWTANTYTWTRPPLSQYVSIIGIGEGGPGGGGARYSTITIRTGGTGGNGSYIVSRGFKASILGGTETVTVTGTNAGGAAAVGDTANGGNGQIGGTSTFGNWVAARPGLAGIGGKNATPQTAQTVVPSNSTYGIPGQSTNSLSTAAATAGGQGITGAGGSGGSADVASTNRAPSAGGLGSPTGGTIPTAGVAGVAGGASPTAGTSRSLITQIGGAGGGGGAYNTGTIGQTGGAGGWPGGGGGGAGASDNGFASGVGGVGGGAMFEVTTSF